MKFIIALMISMVSLAQPPKGVNSDYLSVQSWIDAKVKDHKMTKKQGQEAMKHPDLVKKVMDSEKLIKGGK